jgi:hypothetical protein
METKLPIKWITTAVLSIIGIIVFLFINPFSWNDAGHRTVVEQMSGNQFVQYQPGIYYSGFFCKTTEWPNQISVSYQDTTTDMEMKDGTIEIGKIKIRFGGDATTADVSGIVQYILPSDETEMITMHNAHRTPQSLVTKRLAPYTKECLQSSAQLMSSEMHYSGGRATMSQDFGEQLRGGVYLLKTNELMVYDSLEKENKRLYETKIQTDKNGNPVRKISSIKEYGITVADANITDVDYETRVDNMLGKKIDASTKASIAKQELITAQQQGLTAKAQGEKTLIETEYKQKVEQTKLVVAAQTQVQVAELETKAAQLQAQKTKTQADAESYKNAKLVAAGLTPQERAQFEMDTKIGVAKALSEVTLPSTYINGNTSGGNNNSMLESILGVKLLEQNKK